MLGICSYGRHLDTVLLSQRNHRIEQLEEIICPNKQHDWIKADVEYYLSQSKKLRHEKTPV